MFFSYPVPTFQCFLNPETVPDQAQSILCTGVPDLKLLITYGTDPDPSI